MNKDETWRAMDYVEAGVCVCVAVIIAPLAVVFLGPFYAIGRIARKCGYEKTDDEA